MRHKLKPLIGIWLILMFISVAGAEPIKIAAIFPQSGFAAENNVFGLNGVRLAIEELNLNNGILGRPLELITINTHSTLIGAKIAASKAVEAGVCGIIGPTWSSDALAAAKVAQEHGVPLITTLSTHPEVTKVGDCIFRVCFNDQFQGKALARFVRKELGAEAVVVMTDMISDYSMELAKIFTQHFEHDGGKILATLKYKRTADNFTPILKEAESFAPDVFFIPSHMEIRKIAEQSLTLGMSRTLVGGDGWQNTNFKFSDQSFLKLGYHTAHWAKEANIEAFQEFVKRYPLPEYYVPGLLLAYDAVMLLADAISRAGSDKPAAVREALAKTVNFPGTTGLITMDQHGDPIKNAVLIKIENGVKSYFKTIAP